MNKRPVNVEVRIRRGDNIERMIKLFTKKVQKSWILDDHKFRMRYKTKKEKAVYSRRKRQQRR